MKIIGLIGKKKSGKTTVANYIVELLHPRVVSVVGFADALKKEVAYMLLQTECSEQLEAGFLEDTERAIENTLKHIEVCKSNYRLLLQWWGTDYRRKMFDENYWVRKVEQTIQSDNLSDVLIVPDVRFFNESNMIKKQEGVLIKIVRDDLEASIDGHQSETEMDSIDFDYVIPNDGDIQDLKFSVRNLLRDSLNLYA